MVSFWRLAEAGAAVSAYLLGVFKMKAIKQFVGATVLATLGLFGMAGSAIAAGPDLTSLTTAVDFGTVTTAVLSVAAALIVVYIAWKGAQLVLAAVKRG
jgi:hypothetical protein